MIAHHPPHRRGRSELLVATYGAFGWLALTIGTVGPLVILIAGLNGQSYRPTGCLSLLLNGEMATVTFDYAPPFARHVAHLDGTPMEDAPRSVGSATFTALPAERPPVRGLSRRWKLLLWQRYDRSNRALAVWQHGGASFVTYDPKTGRAKGYAGLSGTEPEPPPVDRLFAVPLTDFSTVNWHAESAVNYFAAGNSPQERYLAPKVYLFVANGRIWELDPSVPRVTERAEVPGARMIATAEVPLPGVAAASEGQPCCRPALVVRTGAELVVLDGWDTPRQTFPIPPEVGPHGFEFFCRSDGGAVIHVDHSDRWEEGGHELFWLAPDGAVERRQTVARLDAPPFPTRTQLACLLPVAVPAPLVAAVSEAVLWTKVQQVMSLSSGRPVPPFPGMARALLGLLGVLSLACTVACVRRQRRYAQPGTPYWVAFMLLFGPPGYLAYLQCRRWPTLDDCPNCGRNAPRDRPACAFCSADFPPAAATGTEIYDGWRTAPE